MIDTIIGIIELIWGWITISPQLIWMMYSWPFYNWETFFIVLLVALIPLTLWSFFDQTIYYKFFKLLITAPLWLWVLWSIGYWFNSSNYNF